MGSYGDYRDRLSREFDAAARSGDERAVLEFLQNGDIDGYDKQSALDEALEAGKAQCAALIYPEVRKRGYIGLGKLSLLRKALKGKSPAAVEMVYEDALEDLKQEGPASPVALDPEQKGALMAALGGMHGVCKDGFEVWLVRFEEDFKPQRQAWEHALGLAIAQAASGRAEGIGYAAWIFQNRLGSDFGVKVQRTLGRAPLPLDKYLEMEVRDNLIREKLLLYLSSLEGLGAARKPGL